MTILDLLCNHHLFWSNLQMELLNRFDWLIRLPLPFSGETFVQSLKILAAWFCWVKQLIYIQIIGRCSLLSLSNWREQETEILDFQVVPVTGHFCNKLLSLLMQISSVKSCHFCSKNANYPVSSQKKRWQWTFPIKSQKDLEWLYSAVPLSFKLKIKNSSKILFWIVT